MPVLHYDSTVAANPPKNDACLPYPDARFVLVRNIGRLKPGRGLVLEWRRNRRRWEAFVIWRDDTALLPTNKIEWMPAARLIPVRVDPNWRDPG